MSVLYIHVGSDTGQTAQVCMILSVHVANTVLCFGLTSMHTHTHTHTQNFFYCLTTA
ncbi:hypothetical protein EXN66_Car003544 [Channa argus]|uniref:Uncharacterized protein n=1 Tax=Channa argus TaxID=215402 RepID=A0A6G1PCA6_CHAAH|nr:hypothetical protein EXN66_Car003544 [Channa argus]